MKWYRFFTSSEDGTTVTADSSLTTLAVNALTATSLKTSTVTAGGQTTACPYLVLPGSARIYVWATMTTTAVPVPHQIGDLGICTGTGKLYIAGAVSASTDWKVVTSA